VTPAGSLERGVLGVNTELSVSKLDLTTQESANFAVRIIDAALEVISSARAESGAFQNRVTHELENLSETLFQTQRYQSRIQDADMAAETARFARSQIVQSAGVEVLRQVNQAGLLGLELLRGLTS
jgi:flagellin